MYANGLETMSYFLHHGHLPASCHLRLRAKLNRFLVLALCGFAYLTWQQVLNFMTFGLRACYAFMTTISRSETIFEYKISRRDGIGNHRHCLTSNPLRSAKISFSLQNPLIMVCVTFRRVGRKTRQLKDSSGRRARNLNYFQKLPWSKQLNWKDQNRIRTWCSWRKRAILWFNNNKHYFFF